MYPSRGFDSFTQTAEDDDPGQSQTTKQGPPHLSHVMYTVGDLQHIVTETHQKLVWWGKLKIGFKFLVQKFEKTYSQNSSLGIDLLTSLTMD